MRISTHDRTLPSAPSFHTESDGRCTRLILQDIENRFSGLMSAIVPTMARRTIVAVLCLELLTLGLGSAFACNLFAVQQGMCERGSNSPDCVCPESSSQPAKLVSPADSACCAITQAPPLESSINFTPAASAAALVRTNFHFAPPRAVEHPSPAFPRVVSPPDLQPLLCVFLI